MRRPSDFEVICPESLELLVCISIKLTFESNIWWGTSQELSLHSSQFDGICVAWAGPWYRRMLECRSSNVPSQESISQQGFMWSVSGYQYTMSGLTGAICTPLSS